MRHIKKLDEYLEIFEKCLVVLIFSALILLIVFNIISRNLFQSSFQTVLEISPALVLWLALLGSTLALKKQRHIKMEILFRFCSEKMRTFAVLTSSIFGVAVMGVLFWASFEFVKNEIEIFGQWGWVSMIFPIFFAICSFRYFVRLIDNLLVFRFLFTKFNKQ